MRVTTDEEQALGQVGDRGCPLQPFVMFCCIGSRASRARVCVACEFARHEEQVVQVARFRKAGGVFRWGVVS